MAFAVNVRDGAVLFVAVLRLDVVVTIAALVAFAGCLIRYHKLASLLAASARLGARAPRCWEKREKRRERLEVSLRPAHAAVSPAGACTA